MTRVLLIGDNCIDEYHIGVCDRLSPEAPVPVIKIVDQYTAPGMAGNVKRNFENLGLDVEFISNTEEIKKIRYIDKRSGQHMLRVDSEPKITEWQITNSLKLESYDAIVISDYNKGFLTYEKIEHIIKSVRCPVFIDTKKTELADISAAWVYIKINELEARNARSTPSNLIVTLGDRGASYNGKLFPANPVEVTDVCGAGDTFLAALTYEYLNTKSIEAAIEFANRASSITVTKNGVYAPTLEEILRD